MKKTNSTGEPLPPTSDLQKLITEFEEVTNDLAQLAASDKEERQLVEDCRAKLIELESQVSGILSGNERARRERQVKLSNLQELLRPILFPMTECCNQATSMSATECLNALRR